MLPRRDFSPSICSETTRLGRANIRWRAKLPCSKVSEAILGAVLFAPDRLHQRAVLARRQAAVVRPGVTSVDVKAQKGLARTSYRGFTAGRCSALSLCHVAREHVRWRHSQCFADFDELNDVQPPLAALELRDEGLRIVEPPRQVDLRDAKLPAHLAQQV